MAGEQYGTHHSTCAYGAHKYKQALYLGNKGGRFAPEAAPEVCFS
ncbi:hypothetical protein [Pontibacter anaerobius]|uniref:Uncharacterized protein n=1 Tax=Pontibacter anaerobius TaxID=2993940 RepID=A0ABT3RGF3_9BACT|nr:hypothetical protein [Pontibacter anaerobius]MCX2740918.1 hypothetical protein [Pontibacter anaerobius]